jgi:hypothetical protein
LRLQGVERLSRKGWDEGIFLETVKRRNGMSNFWEGWLGGGNYRIVKKKKKKKKKSNLKIKKIWSMFC